MKFPIKEEVMPAQTWKRRADGSTATLFADRVEFCDGTVTTECPWSPACPLDAMLYALDYAPVTR